MATAAKGRLGRNGLVRVGALAPALAAQTGECIAKTLQLSISGDAGARYSGACTLTVASRDERIELEGAVPLQRTFDGDALTCRLAVQGRVVFEIGHHGGRSRSASNGGVVQVSTR